MVTSSLKRSNMSWCVFPCGLWLWVASSQVCDISQWVPGVRLFLRGRVVTNKRGEISGGKVKGSSLIFLIVVQVQVFFVVVINRIILVIPVHLSVNLIKNHSSKFVKTTLIELGASFPKKYEQELRWITFVKVGWGLVLSCPGAVGHLCIW